MNNLTIISKEQFYNVYTQSTNLMLIDVRSPMEYQTQHVKESFNIPLDNISPENVESLLAKHNFVNDECVYLICKSGKRSILARQKLKASARSFVCVDGGVDEMRNDKIIQFKKGSSRVISLERQVRIATGALTLTGVLLGAFVHPAAYSLAAFVGAGLMVAGITDWCGMGLLIAKMPWNKVQS